MPKFFLPSARDEEMGEKAYLEIKANVEGHPWKIASDRIFAVDHKHDGKLIHSEVGEIEPENGETVVAIFRAIDGPFLVCTTNRGVARGLPMLTAGDGRATLFDLS